MDADSLESDNQITKSVQAPASPSEVNDSLAYGKLMDGKSTPQTAVGNKADEKCATAQSPVPSSTDGELSSDSAPDSPKGFYGAVCRDALEKISDDDSLDLNSEPASPVAFIKEAEKVRTCESFGGDKNAKQLAHLDSNLIQTTGEQSCTNSGKDIAHSLKKYQQSSDKGAGDILSFDEQADNGSDDGSLHTSGANSVKGKGEQKESTLSIHDRLDLSYRGSHDDHGELDYEEDVDDGLDTSKRDIDDGDVEDKEEGEESEAEDGEHISDDDTDGELKDDDDCEEGEIKDAPSTKEDADRPGQAPEQDEFSGQPLCRFYMRGSCTWGLNCRFFHPGVPNGSFNNGRKPWDDLGPPEADVLPPPPPPAVPATETAWERGLRQARELRKKSQKRKEMEPDFEEKRKNLSLNDTDVIEEPVLKSVPEDVDFNKENEQEPIILDPYYDNMYEDDDKDFNYSRKEPVEGWHGSGHYENFEVQWTRDQSRHVPDPYPDFRLPERDRVIVGKEKYPSKYRYDQAPGHDRYDKRKDMPKNVYKKYEKYENYEDVPEKVRPVNPIKEVEATRFRGEEWIDPWQRARSPVRRKNSSSRSRSRGRRRSRSHSGSSSYSSDSLSSRSSLYSSRSSYSRSSSYSSSRSSSRSRSPPARRKPLLLRDSHRKTVLNPKSSEIAPRNLVAKAGPVVPSAAIDREIEQKRALAVASPEKRPPGTGIERRPPPSHKPTAGMPRVENTSSKIPEGPQKPPLLPKPAPKPVIRTATDTGRTAPDPRPGRSLRTRARSISSGSSSSRSRSRSFSSSGTSSRSRSRSHSSSASSSSSSSSSDSDDLYRDMASPVDSKGSESPSPNKAKRKSYKGQSKDSQDNWKTNRDRDPDKDASSREQPLPYAHRKEDKIAQAPVISQTKDPLKLQGQKLNIKLTLKSSKSADPSLPKKRPLDATGDGPPNKRALGSPAKEAKEPVRMTLPKTEKLAKPAKELSGSHDPVDSPTSKTQAKSVIPAKPVPAPVTPAIEPVPALKKKSTSSRREELLKQLKAVEDAIARKRTKLN